MIARFCRDTRGATALEYALMSGLIGLFILGAVNTFSTQLTATFSALSALFTAVR